MVQGKGSRAQRQRLPAEPGRVPLLKRVRLKRVHAKPKVPLRPVALPIKWKPLDVSSVKINTDVALDVANQLVRFGVDIGNHLGQIGVIPDVIESDASSVVDLVNGGVSSFADIGLVVFDIQKVYALFSSELLNGVTNFPEHWNLQDEIPEEQEHNSPEFIQSGTKKEHITTQAIQAWLRKKKHLDSCKNQSVEPLISEMLTHKSKIQADKHELETMLQEMNMTVMLSINQEVQSSKGQKPQLQAWYRGKVHEHSGKDYLQSLEELLFQRGSVLNFV
ncbi:hypothetical protein ACOSQ4_019984 [Xanthoceras sorbifolium]